MAVRRKIDRKESDKVNNSTFHSLKEAVTLVKSSATAKFDETVDVALNLNLDPRKSDQNLRGMIQLPNGTGKKTRVAVFARDEKADEKKSAGADIVGAEDLIEIIQKGQIDFDRCIATPDLMTIVGKLGKILGPKGLMPNPKLGTITVNVGDAVKAAKAGQIEYKTEKAGIIHVGVGKVSFSEEALLANIKAFTDVIMKNRPSSVKGSYIKGFSIASTMGPSIKIAAGEL